MPGSLPGLPGAAAFAGLKFGGYLLAGMALRKCVPAIQKSALRIAATRTGLGILLGPLFSVGYIALLEALFPNPSQGPPDYSGYLYYALLAGLRVLVWALVIYLVAREVGLSRGKLWAYASAGALWSCLLDVPGLALAWVAPGKIGFC